MSRRRFLAAGCAACAGAATGLMIPKAYAAGEDARTRVRIVYALHGIVQPKPTWPNVGFDFAPVMANIESALKKGCPDMEFVTSTATDADGAAEILKQDMNSDIDGYVVYQMNNWNQVASPFVASGKPVLFADFTYGGSGGFLRQTAGFLRNNTPNLGFVGSSNIDDVIAAAKCFAVVKKDSTAEFAAATAKARLARTPKPGDLSCTQDSFKTSSIENTLRRMKKSKILAVRDQKSGPAAPFINIPTEMVSFEEINAAWKAADQDEVRAIADRWEKAAAAIVNVLRETLESSAAMYLGMKAVLKEHGANAITINCLGGFYGGHIHAYPCLGFHELSNAGLVGGCECDVRSTGSMVVLNALTQGRPGYISDPVLDTAKRQIIYAHCVASNRPFGPQGATNPFQILTHSEDRKGAAVRSILPLGYMTTTLEIDPAKKQILFHQGKAVANDPDDRACRTKLGVEPVGDIEKLFRMWDQWGWHRVTVYGNLKDPITALADALKFEVVNEA
jgi:hypothetical protein